MDNLTVEIPSGQVTVIIGANGCGKSTLLRGLARLLTPVAGAVLLDGKSVHGMPSKEVAKLMGLLPQAPVAPEGITVADLVGRGRYPHQGWFRRWSDDDDRAVADALSATDTLELAGRPIEDMSGGQRQRVWIAMALAQETELLLLDEPTTYLDLSHQIEVLDLLDRPQPAPRDDYRDRDARPQSRLPLRRSPDRDDRRVDHRAGRTGRGDHRRDDQAVFGMSAAVVDDPISGTPTVVPIGRHHCAAADAGVRGT